MAVYRVLIKTSAGKEMSRLGSKSDRQRIVDRIGKLAEDPRPFASEKLAGYEDRYRIRQGNFRVAYLIDDTRKDITIFKAGDRKGIYK